MGLWEDVCSFPLAAFFLFFIAYYVAHSNILVFFFLFVSYLKNVIVKMLRLQGLTKVSQRLWKEPASFLNTSLHVLPERSAEIARNGRAHLIETTNNNNNQYISLRAGNGLANGGVLQPPTILLNTFSPRFSPFYIFQDNFHSAATGRGKVVFVDDDG